MYNLLHFVSNVYNTVHNLGVTNIPKVAKLNKHQHNVQLGAADIAALCVHYLYYSAQIGSYKHTKSCQTK